LEKSKYGGGVNTLNGSRPSDYLRKNLHIFITTQKAHTMNNINYIINIDSTVPRSMDTGVS
jgi:hypothetical protein